MHGAGLRLAIPADHTASTQGDDSTSDKITGSIINAVIFVGVIALMTFLLVLLFKYGVSKLQAVSDVVCRC